MDIQKDEKIEQAQQIISDPANCWILTTLLVDVREKNAEGFASSHDWQALVHLKKMNASNFAGLVESLSMTEKVILHELLKRYLGIEVVSKKQYVED